MYAYKVTKVLHDNQQKFNIEAVNDYQPVRFERFDSNSNRSRRFDSKFDSNGNFRFAGLYLQYCRIVTDSLTMTAITGLHKGPHS